MKYLLLAPTFSLFVYAAQPSFADIKVISNAKNGTDFSHDDIRNAYLGKNVGKASGARALDYSKNSPMRQDFLNQAVNTTPTAFRSHWSRMIFTGAATPPDSVSSEEDMIKRVGENEGAIGYVDSKTVLPANVKVQMTISTE